MRVISVPQRRDNIISYAFSGEVVVATVDGVTDTFDFTNLPDGEATEILSHLDPCPVLGAERVNGELTLTLLKPIPAQPQRRDYDSQEEYETALEAWHRLWTDDLEVTIGG